MYLLANSMQFGKCDVIRPNFSWADTDPTQSEAILHVQRWTFGIYYPDPRQRVWIRIQVQVKKVIRVQTIDHDYERYSDPTQSEAFFYV